MRFWMLINLILVLLIGSCSNRQDVIVKSGFENHAVCLTSKQLFAFPALCTFEDIATGEKILPSQFEGAKISSYFFQKSVSLLEKKGFRIESKYERSPMAQTETIYHKLNGNRKELLYRKINESLNQQLQLFEPRIKGHSILILYLKIKIGEKGGWNPISGEIISDSGYSNLKAKIINTSNGNSLWFNEVQLRSPPISDSPDFTRAIEQLFKSIRYSGEMS